MFTLCFCSDSKNKNEKTELQETGFDRVKRMFKPTDFGFISPELNHVIYSALLASSVSAIFGGMSYAHQARENYLRKNVATQFESQHLAKRKLVDTMTLSACRGAFKYGLKYGSFSSLYMLSTMTAANYNNKITVWEHIGSGALIGGLFRTNYGLKGMLAGASAGSVLGAFAGAVVVFSLWLAGTNFQELRYWESTSYLESRKKRFEAEHEEPLKRL